MVGVCSLAVAALVAGAPNPAEAPNPASLRPSVDEYDRRRVVIDAVYVVGVGAGHFVVPRRFTSRTGDGRPLTGPAFYDYVDRPDLARLYMKRHRLRWTLGGVGIGMVAAGTALTLSYVGVDGKAGNALLGSGLGLIVGALVPIAVGGSLSPHPVSSEEAVELARKKNARLQDDLGFPAHFELQLSPLGSRQGGGAQLSGRF